MRPAKGGHDRKLMSNEVLPGDHAVTHMVARSAQIIETRIVTQIHRRLKSFWHGGLSLPEPFPGMHEIRGWIRIPAKCSPIFLADASCAPSSSS